MARSVGPDKQEDGETMNTRGFGRVYQRGRVWWVQYSYRGTVHRESSGCSNRTDAVKLLRRRLEEMGRGRLIGHDAERTTFGDLAQMLLDDYRVNGRKSTERAACSVKRLREFFGQSRAVDITADRAAAYVRGRQDAGAKPATIKNELAALKRMFTLAVEAEKLAHRPHILSIEVRNVRTGFFGEPDLRAVLVTLSDDLQPVAEFAYLTGWRKGEILTLQWWQVDFTAGIIRLEPGTTKNDDGRVLPFAVHPALEALLRRQRERTVAVERATGQIIPWVFHRRGRPITDFRAAWTQACDAAGLSGRVFHDFRRTAVRNLERAGVARSVAMKLTGHKTETVYRRYAIVSESDLAEGVKKLAALHASTIAGSRTVVPISATLPGRTSTLLAQSVGRDA